MRILWKIKAYLIKRATQKKYAKFMLDIHQKQNRHSKIKATRKAFVMARARNICQN